MNLSEINKLLLITPLFFIILCCSYKKKKENYIQLETKYIEWNTFNNGLQFMLINSNQCSTLINSDEAYLNELMGIDFENGDTIRILTKDLPDDVNYKTQPIIGIDNYISNIKDKKIFISNDSKMYSKKMKTFLGQVYLMKE